MRNKSVLIIDTPKNCYDCNLSYDCYCCSITNTNFFNREDFDPCEDILPDCPLYPLPQCIAIPKISRGDSKSLTHTAQMMYGLGYNKCIDDILK